MRDGRKQCRLSFFHMQEISRQYFLHNKKTLTINILRVYLNYKQEGRFDSNGFMGKECTMENLSPREKGKQMRQTAIIAAAETIFCRGGYEEASMDEIAKKAQFTKRTVYQYFASKEDLYFAVALKGFEGLYSSIKEESKNQRTAYDQLERSCRSYYRFYKENPDIFGLINYWGNIKRRTEDGNKYKTELIRFNNEIFQEVEELLLEGKKDGSIQQEIDAKQTAYSLVFLMTGFFNQMSTTGDNFAEHFSLNQESFSFFTIDLVLKTIKKSKVNAMTRKGTV